MAKHVIGEQYTFSPGTSTNGIIVITGKSIQRERLILILNVTTNTVIYNFSDSSLTASSYTISTAGTTETTTIRLTKDTSGMSSTDKLSIIVDEVNETLMPAETVMDPVGKMRVSNPQALIDTDFEYGVQSTKWEALALTNNRPSAFYDPTQGLSNLASVQIFPGSSGSYTISNIAGNGTTRLVTVTINNTNGISVNTPIYVQDTTDPNANGWYLPNVINANNSFTYYARNIVVNGSVFDPTKTFIFVGSFYTGAAIPCGTSAISVVSGSLLQVTTTNAHGLNAGQAIYIVGVTASGGTAPNGAWTVKTVPTSNTFTFDVSALPSAPSGSIVTLSPSNGINGSIYTRTWGTSIHRAYDGGVTFSAGYPYHGNQLIRQTRRVFRYQSGKGIQFSTGSNLCSPYQVDSLTASGTTVTVSTKYPHNLGVGAIVKVSGANESGYSGSWAVTSTPTDLTFTYTALISPVSPATTTSNGFTVQAINWYGASTRIGMFTSQNGFFFEYDGQTLSAVRRTSTNQLTGYIGTLAQYSQTVTGVGTLFAQQLIPGSYVVIRGMSYVISSIESNTSMTIYPDYRGSSISSPSQVVISLTQDTKYPQSTWNIDKMDGTGSSSNTLDISKMQMWYIDYTWYGAGSIRWGFKDQRGEIKYVHREPHANLLTEAYMRSGNLPARYEVNTLYPVTIATASVGVSDSSISVTSTVGYPSSGSIIVRGSGNTGAAVEYMNYSSKTSTSFAGLTRGVVTLTGPGNLSGLGGGAASAFTYSATAPISVSYWGPQSASTISHWGSSVIMDGRYDNDKSLVFVAGMASSIINIGTNVTQPLISLRIAPSVDSGLTGVLGQREIVNTMQLILNGCDAFTTAAASTTTTFLITLRLNGQLAQGTAGSLPAFTAAGGSSLAQVAYHVAGNTIVGGETIYGFFTTTPGVTAGDLTLVRDLGNSIMGGGNTYAVPTTAQNKYPDGPDIVTICAQNVTAGVTNSINARVSWTEAQA